MRERERGGNPSRLVTQATHYKGVSIIEGLGCGDRDQIIRHHLELLMEV